MYLLLFLFKKQYRDKEFQKGAMCHLENLKSNSVIRQQARVEKVFYNKDKLTNRSLVNLVYDLLTKIIVFDNVSASDTNTNKETKYEYRDYQKKNKRPNI